MFFDEGKRLIKKISFNSHIDERHLFQPISRRKVSFISLSETNFIEICKQNSEPKTEIKTKEVFKALFE